VIASEDSHATRRFAAVVGKVLDSGNRSEAKEPIVVPAVGINLENRRADWKEHQIGEIGPVDANQDASVVHGGHLLKERHLAELDHADFDVWERGLHERHQFLFVGDGTLS